MMKACPNRTRFLHTKERNRINGKNHRRKDKTSTSIKIAYKFKAHDSLEDVRATLYVYKKLQAQESEL